MKGPISPHDIDSMKFLIDPITDYEFLNINAIESLPKHGQFCRLYMITVFQKGISQPYRATLANMMRRNS